MDYIEYTNEVNNLSESLEDRLFDSFEISDKELQKIYKYYIYGGFRNIKLLEIMNFCSTLFMILFIQIIFRCIDYEGLSHVENSNEEKKYLWDFIKLSGFIQISFFNICFLLIFGIYIFLRILGIYDAIKQYGEIKLFLEKKIGTTDTNMNKLSWKDFCHKLEEYLKLNSYQIHSKILRKENFLIEIFDSQINKYVFSKLMEWNLIFCILNPLMENMQFRKVEFQNSNETLEKDDSEFVEDENEYTDNSNDSKIFFKNKGVIKKKCILNLIVLAYLTFLCMPFLIIYNFFFTFLKYGERYYHNPTKITLRNWSLASNWKIRYYNELSHFLDTRLDTGSRYAKQYLDCFQCQVRKYIFKFITLVCSSIFISLMILSIYNENILLHLHISQDKHVLWYLGILASLIAICRNLGKTKNKNKEDIEIVYQKLETIFPLINQKRYHLTSNPENLSKKRKKIISSLYVYQLISLLQECFSVIVIPFCLIYLANYVENIIDKVEKKLHYDSQIGFINQPSNFRNIDSNSSLKSIYSFREFRNHNPDWGANIEIYRIGNISFLKNNVEMEERVINYDNEVFQNTVNSSLSIL